jgi:hypothetical protein
MVTATTRRCLENLPTATLIKISHTTESSSEVDCRLAAAALSIVSERHAAAVAA